MGTYPLLKSFHHLGQGLAVGVSAIGQTALEGQVTRAGLELCSVWCVVSGYDVLVRDLCWNWRAVDQGGSSGVSEVSAQIRNQRGTGVSAA